VGRVIRGDWARVLRSPRPRPTEAAAGHLSEVLHKRIKEHRRALATEFTVIEALARMGELDAVARGLEDQRLAWRALSTDLKAVIADAAVEQPLDAWRGLPATASASPSRGSKARGTAGGGPGSRSRFALALAAAILGFVFVAGIREQPLRMFSAHESREIHEERAAWSEIHAARKRLATLAPTQTDAEEVAAETRAVHDRILSLPDSALASKSLQSEIRGLLAEQSGALRGLQANPDAKSLLAEVRALSTSLGLDLPEPPVQPVQVRPPLPAPKLPPAPALEQIPSQQAPPVHLVPEQPASQLPLPEQPDPSARHSVLPTRPDTGSLGARPDPGKLNVRRVDHAPHPHTPSAPTAGLQTVEP
jgi:hypothetical protein